MKPRRAPGAPPPGDGNQGSSGESIEVAARGESLQDAAQDVRHGAIVGRSDHVHQYDSLWFGG